MHGDASATQLEDVLTIVEGYLDTYVRTPALESIRQDLSEGGSHEVAHRLPMVAAVVLTMARMVLDKEPSPDVHYFRTLPAHELERCIEVLEEFVETGEMNAEVGGIIEKGSAPQFLLPYLISQLNWVTVSILSTSYLSAHVTMRSVLELLLGIATRENGPLPNRLDAIPYLSPEEKVKIKQLWRRLCGWTHPYGKWLKEICPVFALRGPTYHPRLCRQCMEELELIADLALVIAQERFGADIKAILREANLRGGDTSSLTMCLARTG